MTSFMPETLKNNSRFKKLFYKFIVRSYDYMEAEQNRESLKNILEEHYDEKLEEIKIKVLVIWGKRDSYVPVWMGEKLHKSINDSKITVIDNARHSLPIVLPKNYCK